MSRTRHGHWGIGHTSNLECARRLLPPPLICCMQEPRGTSLMPCTTYAYVAWALGNRTNTQSTTMWQRQGDDDTTRRRQRKMPKTRLRGEATTTPPRDTTMTHDPTTRDVATQQHETRAARRNKSKSLW
jgi:hypothetical protein